MTVDHKIHFRILEDIAQDLSGEINFPTCLDAAIMVRNTLRDPEVTLDRVAHVVEVEPLIASKLLRLSNSVSYNPSGRSITDLKTAIGRLGFEVVRTTSLAVAMDQMLKSRHLAGFDTLSRQTWEHSLHIAAIARVLARRIGRVSPDEAMLAGMVHHIGVFYLLYRAAEYPEYRESPDAVVALVAGWHRSIGESLLHVLGLPDRIVESLREPAPGKAMDNPCTLTDIVYFANILAGGDMEWLRGAVDAEQLADEAAQREGYADLLGEAEDDIRELRSALSA